MPLSVLFAVTILIAGASQPVIEFVTAPDSDYASEMVLSETYGEIVSVEEVSIPPDEDNFANSFFTVEPQSICAYPIADIFPDESEKEMRGVRMEFNGRLVEVLELFPNNNVHVEDLETGKEFMTDLIYLDRID